MMRGSAAPVVDAAQCVLGRPGEPTRFVAVRAGERRIALAVDAVLGTIELADDRASELPGLLSGASAAVAATAALDQTFLLLLQAGRMLPEFELANHAGNH